jgi:tRNA G37 N-methylase TrmD
VKYLVWIVILGLVGFLAYSYYWKAASKETTQVRDLEREFARDVDRYITSMRQAGEPGIVILADPETAIKKVQETRNRVTALLPKLTEKKAIARAQQLEERIRQFCRANQID